MEPPASTEFRQPAPAAPLSAADARAFARHRCDSHLTQPISCRCLGLGRDAGTMLSIFQSAAEVLLHTIDLKPTQREVKRSFRLSKG